MPYITLDEAKAYLRQDSGFEDDLIQILIKSAESFCMDVARMTKSQWSAVSESTEDSDLLEINGTNYTGEEQMGLRDSLRTAVLFVVGYLYEHREEADHKALALTLRNLLFSVREGVV